MKTLKIIISGTVQGVFFRKYIEEKANELKIRGFIRNLENGDLEVVAEGRDENVNELLGKCKQGPSQSDVKEVRKEELKHQGLKGFKVLSM